MNKTTASAAQ